ncbi:MAG: hypothetical protein NUW12_09105 [Firmicutes bacterium]|jgi:uncharacterized membrane protein YkvI|nr:hypothetical protein [Bacillota bacterium]MDH7496211.1 hypothetical protein [Bacillota bacterium]
MDGRHVSALAVAATYIGTVVGAGFASGQEVLQFFGHFGLRGIPAIGLAVALFSLYGYVILELGRSLGARSHLPVVREAGGRVVGTAIDGVITFFLFGALVAMTAGAGAVLHEQFGLSAAVGNVLLVVAAFLTVLAGIHGVVTAISVVVPALLVAVVGISVATLLRTPLDLAAVRSLDSTRAAVPSWPLSAVVYVSYNIVLAVGVLAPLGAIAEGPHPLKLGAILGGIGLGLGALAIHLALLATLPKSAAVQVPMVYIAGRFPVLVQVGYSLVLLLEIYTTAVGNLYGFVARIAKPGTRASRWLVIAASLVALLAGRLGFSRIVRTLYPAVGYAGLLLLLALTYQLVRRVFIQRDETGRGTQ